MDSLTQFVLGAAVGLAVSPVKNRKIALLGGALATLPDLDILLNYEDELITLINHRSFSHSLFVLTALSFPLAYGLQKGFKNLALNYWQWLNFCIVVLVTHPLLDAFTIFGTQLFWPLEVSSTMIGSIFIIDPIYTLPLLVSFLLIMIKNRPKQVFGHSANTLALIFSTAYLALSLLLQTYVSHYQTYPHAVIESDAKLVTPTPMNLLIWRTIVRTDDKFYEGFYHLFKGNGRWKATVHNQNTFKLDNMDNIKKYAHFSHGFYRLKDKNGKLMLNDVRMGSLFAPVFSFHIANKNNNWQVLSPKRYTHHTFDFEQLFGGQDFF